MWRCAGHSIYPAHPTRKKLIVQGKLRLSWAWVPPVGDVIAVPLCAPVPLSSVLTSQHGLAWPGFGV